jgi:hypothetical protein
MRNGTAMGPNMTPSYPIIFIEHKNKQTIKTKLKQNKTKQKQKQLMKEQKSISKTKHTFLCTNSSLSALK